MLTPREKSPLPEKFSPEEDGTHDAASSRTAVPAHYRRAIPALACFVQLAILHGRTDSAPNLFTVFRKKIDHQMFLSGFYECMHIVNV